MRFFPFLSLRIPTGLQPPHHPSRVARDDAVILECAADDCPGTHNAPLTEDRPLEDQGIATDEAVLPDNYRAGPDQVLVIPVARLCIQRMKIVVKDLGIAADQGIVPDADAPAGILLTLNLQLLFQKLKH